MGDSQPVEKRKIEPSQYSYLISILVAFVAPILFLSKDLRKRIPPAPFYVSVAIIGVLGWIWSYIVSSHLWWVFGEKFLTGIKVIPNLPIEELLFYPLGGAICILFYLKMQTQAAFKNKISAKAYWIFIVLGTIVFTALVAARWHVKPYYLTSQLVLYNLLCTLLLAPWVAKNINLPGLALPVGILTVVGYSWNWIGFKYGWWVYNATTQIYLSVVPIDDCNFYFFAPTAAVSLYVFICQIFKSPQSRP